MRQNLLVHLPARAGDDIAWTLFAPGGDAVERVGSGDLDDLLTANPTWRVIALVPTEQVLLTSVDLPVRQPNKLLQAVPYALEDRLAEDVDKLHFALGSRHAGTTPVAVVNRDQMEAWLETFGAHRHRLDALLPDVLALPWQPQQTVVHISSNSRCLIRQGANAGFACPLDLLTEMLEQHEDVSTILLKSELAPALADAIALDQSRLFRSDTESFVLPMDLRSRPNLLQGAFAPQHAFGKWLKLARVPAALAASWLILATVSLAATNLQKSRDLDAARSLSEQTFQKGFPEITRIVDMRIQAEQQLARLRSGQAQGGFLSLLTDTSDTVGKVKGLKLEGVQFRDGALYLSLSGSDLQALEVLRAEFAKRSALKLDVQSAQAGSEGVQIRLKVEAA